MNSEEKISKAMSRMCLLYPWWASCALHLNRRPASEYEIAQGRRTAATDGTWLIYNPEYIDSLTDDEIMGVMLHEVAHCILLHPHRLGARDHTRWNIACDMAVNALLEADNIKLPQGCVPPADSLDITAEELYHHVKVQKVELDVMGEGSCGGTGD